MAEGLAADVAAVATAAALINRALGRMKPRRPHYPDMQPGAACSAKGCDEVCVDKEGKRVMGHGCRVLCGRVGKARCCCVCGKWYCGRHKKLLVKRSGKVTGYDAEGDDGRCHCKICPQYHVYKCAGCVGTARERKANRS